MAFRLPPESTTLDDIERPYHTLLHKWCVVRSSPRKIEKEDRRILVVQRLYLQAVYGSCADIYAGLVGRGVKRLQCGQNRRFFVLLVPIFSKPLDS